MQYTIRREGFSGDHCLEVRIESPGEMVIELHTSYGGNFRAPIRCGVIKGPHTSIAMTPDVELEKIGRLFLAAATEYRASIQA